MQPAGNLDSLKDDDLKKTREDLVNDNLNEVEKSEVLLEISDHLKNHKNLLSDDEHFGYYLAGLIEGDGYFGKNSLEISLHIKDVSTAYWLKKRLGSGSLVFVKNQKTVKFVVKNMKGLGDVLTLTNGKFLTDDKLNQWYSNNGYLSFLHLGFEKDFQILPTFNPDLLKSNYFLAGYFDAGGCFNTQIQYKEDKNLAKTVVLEAKLANQNPKVLDLILKFFGGHIYFISNITYRYNSTSFKIAKNWIDYFDQFSLCTTKYIEYIKWRKIYILTQKKEHLTAEGLKKIQVLKKSIEKIRS